MCGIKDNSGLKPPPFTGPSRLYATYWDGRVWTWTGTKWTTR